MRIPFKQQPILIRSFVILSVVVVVLNIMQLSLGILPETTGDMLDYLMFIVGAVYILILPLIIHSGEFVRSRRWMVTFRSMFVYFISLRILVFAEDRIQLLVGHQPGHLIPFWRWLLIALIPVLITGLTEWLRFQRVKQTGPA